MARLLYRFGDVEVDPSQACIRRNGTEKSLRPKVLQVLIYLLQHPDRAVSKEELIQKVWREAAVTDDVVFRCIIDIRAALDDDRKFPRYIRTLPKVGYRLTASVEEVLLETPAPARPEASPPVHDEPAAPAAGPPRRSPWRMLAYGAVGLTAVCATVLAVLAARHDSAEPQWREAAWWRLDERSGAEVPDSSGNGHGGAIPGRPTWVSGRQAQALAFDGSGPYVSGNSERLLPMGNAPRTVTAWIRTASTNGDDTNIFGYGQWEAWRPFNFHLFLRETGQLGCGFGSEQALRGKALVADGNWHFVACTHDGDPNLTRLYVDAIPDQSGSQPVPLQTRPGGSWKIGGNLGSQTRFQGEIDDVRVYQRELRAAEIQALYRCVTAQNDVQLPSAPAFFISVFGANVEIEERQPGERSRSIRLASEDFGGVQFAQPRHACAIGPLRGADIGQDIYMAADLLVARTPQQVSMAGPYFRSRRAGAGDGIIGGTSAGYWVQLYSDGSVRIRRLNPHAVIAYTLPAGDFDDTRFHRLEIAARAATLEVALDGVLQRFDQDGRMVTEVAISPAWEGPPKTGENHGTAGIAFGTLPRGQGAGRQRARNIVVAPFRSLPVGGAAAHAAPATPVVPDSR